jgi:predicted nucleic acid-binding Zn ribbon protein
MAHRVRKQCISCMQLFVGRRDAKTCSERCRKRLQRARLLNYANHGMGMAVDGAQAIGRFDSRYASGKAMASRRRPPEHSL